MEDKRLILLVCSSGMSTSMLMREMQKAADGQGLPFVISSAGTAGIEDEIRRADAILLAPQVRHRFESFSEMAREAGKPIQIVPPEIYGRLDGQKALEMASKMMGL